MSKDEGKTSRKQELKEEIRAIGTRSTWLLGIVVIVVLAIVNLLFQSFTEDLQLFSLAWWAKLIIGLFFLYYFIITMVYIRPLIERTRATTEDLTEEELEKKLDELIKDFKALTNFFVFSLPVMFAFSFGLFLWLLRLI